MAIVRLGDGKRVYVINDSNPIAGETDQFELLRAEIAAEKTGETQHAYLTFADGSKLYFDQMEVTRRDIDVTGDGKDAWEIMEEAKQKRGSRGRRIPGRVTLSKEREKIARNSDKTVIKRGAIEPRRILDEDGKVLAERRDIEPQVFRQHIEAPVTLKPNVNGGQRPIIQYDAGTDEWSFVNCFPSEGATTKPLAPRKGNYQELTA